MKRWLGLLVLTAFLLSGCTVPPSGSAVEIVPGWSDKNLDSRDPNAILEPSSGNSRDLFPDVQTVKPISLTNLDPKTVRAVAGRMLWEEYQSLPVAPSKIKHVLSPTFPKEIQRGTLATRQIGSNFFNDVSDLSHTYVFWTTPKDAVWINDALCKEAKYCENGKEFYFNVGNAMKKSGCDNLGGNQVNLTICICRSDREGIA